MSRQIRQQVSHETDVPGGRRLELTYRLAEGEKIPAVLLLPDARPAPAALLLHGYSSRKEEMAGPVGEALLAEGIASLAIDLPLHGSRQDPLQAQAARNPLALGQLWRRALGDARLGVEYLTARSDVQGDALAVVGYSMGSFLSVVLAAGDPRLRAVVLAAGGDLPRGTPFASVARLVADPLAAVRRLKARPLLMVHGLSDRTVLPEQAQRLFAAAGEPKELRWWDGGHRLPREASRDAAVWLRQALGTSAPDEPHRGEW
jgi:uncharacterized protein